MNPVAHQWIDRKRPYPLFRTNHKRLANKLKDLLESQQSLTHKKRKIEAELVHYGTIANKVGQLLYLSLYEISLMIAILDLQPSQSYLMATRLVRKKNEEYEQWNQFMHRLMGQLFENIQTYRAPLFQHTPCICNACIDFFETFFKKARENHLSIDEVNYLKAAFETHSKTKNQINEHLDMLKSELYLHKRRFTLFYNHSIDSIKIFQKIHAIFENPCDRCLFVAKHLLFENLEKSKQLLRLFPTFFFQSN